MNSKYMSILTNIISAVESGGQIYGNRNYAAYADPYKNSSLEHTITLGWAQNYGSGARELICRIYNKDRTAFRQIDTDRAIESMLIKDWVAIHWNPSYAEKATLIKLIDSPAGHICQDELFAEQMAVLIKDCERDYTKDVKAVMMYCEIRHLGGKPAADRIFKRLNGDYSLDAIMASLVADQKDPKTNQVGDQMYWSRHVKCRQFIDEHIGGEEADPVSGVTAEKILNIYRSWIGKNEHDGSHRSIIDTYNNHKPLARGYKVTYTDDWCDTCLSAAFITAGDVSIIGGTECGVWEHVQIFKKAGIWMGKQKPVKGDIIVFDWQPDGVQDHIGIVENVEGDTVTTIEGNYKDSVGRRTIAWSDKRIAGYARPKYAGHDPQPKEVTAKQSADYFDKKLAGTYVTTTALNMRDGAGSAKYPVIGVLPEGTKVQNYGYYSLNKTARWLYVQTSVDGVKYTGFCSAGYLKKV